MSYETGVLNYEVVFVIAGLVGWETCYTSFFPFWWDHKEFCKTWVVGLPILQLLLLSGSNSCGFLALILGA